MKNCRAQLSLVIAFCGVLAAPAANAAERQATRAVVADVVAGNARIDFVPRFQAPGFVLTVSGPDGAVERQELDSGRAILFAVAGPNGANRPDGVYTYELRARRAAAAAPSGKGNGQETSDGRPVEADAAAKAQPVAGASVQSGSFWIQNGLIISEGATESRAGRSAPAGSGAGRTAAAGRTALDIVNADDVIVQGSLCVGFDCVLNESFGFDTIRLKENNTRIGFSDTSVGSFPANAWQLTANDSASGGANKFSIEDITGAKVPFTLTAGAPTNSIFVDSTGRVGFRTATPVLDLHANTGNTPAMRLEQNSGGGFTAQTWDIAGNEANFFVRDVTGGSRLPFRIRPGAPTSSIDISASGFVGFGIASPDSIVHALSDSPIGADAGHALVAANRSVPQKRVSIGYSTAGSQDAGFIQAINIGVGYRPLVLNPNGGNVGINLNFPSFPIQHANGAYLSVGGAWTNASSREYKQNIRDLSPEAAEDTLAQLNPVTYAYKVAPAEQHVGFIAEDVPEMVATPDRKGLSSMDIVGVLTKVVQEQQKTIKELSERLARIEATEK